MNCGHLLTKCAALQNDEVGTAEAVALVIFGVRPNFVAFEGLNSSRARARDARD